MLRMPGDLKTTAYTSAKPRRSEVDYNRAQKSMDERIQEGSFKAERSFKPERRGKARRAGVSAEKTMAGQKGKRSSSVVDITTAPKGPPKPEAVVAMLRKAVDSCLLFGGMSQAQCDVVINTMLPQRSAGTAKCLTLWQCPELGACTSPGRAWRSRAARHSRSAPRPLGSQPRPQLLERAASQSRAFHRAPFERSGTASARETV